MSRPVILAVDDDTDALRDVERELDDRYGRQYRVLCLTAAQAACDRLAACDISGEEVALVLSAQWLDGMTGTELLDEVRRLHPHARRGLLVQWGEQGDRAIGKVVFDAMAQGRIDHYVIRPESESDELFHHAISGLLVEWAEAQLVSPHTVYVVGDEWSGRAYELREVLGRCAMPHSFHLADSDQGRTLVERAGGGGLPLVLFPNGTVLRDPSNAEIAVASGSKVRPDRLEFDLVIVGAGPAGLSAAVYGASEGFSTLIVDEGGIGGQATSSSSIRNYLGFSRGISGRMLARQAYEQAWVFGASFAFMRRVSDLRHDGDGLSLHLSETGRVRSRAVLLATGARYRRLDVPELEVLIGAGVSYSGAASEAPAMEGADVYVVGGANSAGQSALHLARYARQVTLVVRADSLAAGMSHYLVRQIEATPNIEVRLATEVVGGGGDLRLTHLRLRDGASGSEDTVAADALFLMIGAEPHTQWLPPEIERDESGFVVTGADLGGGVWPLERSPFSLETSMPAVLAAGDVRHGSVKRVASAVGEGSVAIQQLHQLFELVELQPRGREPEPVAVGD
jgi:thioredoxin reductase (NADPH)